MVAGGKSGEPVRGANGTGWRMLTGVMRAVGGGRGADLRVADGGERR